MNEKDFLSYIDKIESKIKNSILSEFHQLQALKGKRGQIYFFGLFINRYQCQKNKSVPFFIISVAYTITRFG